MPGLLGDVETLHPRVPHADRKEARRRAAGGAGVAAEAVSAAPDQGPGRRASCRRKPRSSARSNWPGRSATSTRPCGSRCTRRCARRSPRRASRAATSSILDALLKLRQVCCDPRLVKLAAARKVGASAKLDHLMEMRAVADRGGPAHPAVLAIHQHARSDRAGAGTQPASTSSRSRGDTRDRAGAGQAVPERQGAAVPDQPARPAAPAST